MTVLGGVRTWGHEGWADPLYPAELPALAEPARTTAIIYSETTAWAWLATRFPVDVAFTQIDSSFPRGPAFDERVPRDGPLARRPRIRPDRWKLQLASRQHGAHERHSRQRGPDVRRGRLRRTALDGGSSAPCARATATIRPARSAVTSACAPTMSATATPRTAHSPIARRWRSGRYGFVLDTASFTRYRARNREGRHRLSVVPREPALN